MNVFPLTVLPTSMTLLQNRLFKQRRCAHSNRSSIIIGCIHVIPVHSSKSPLLSTAAARRPSLVTDPGAAGTSLVPWPNPRTLLLCVGRLVSAHRATCCYGKLGCTLDSGLGEPLFMASDGF